jgi:hypothetical protein
MAERVWVAADAVALPAKREILDVTSEGYDRMGAAVSYGCPSMGPDGLMVGEGVTDEIE